jgi:hypothetical protein
MVSNTGQSFPLNAERRDFLQLCSRLGISAVAGGFFSLRSRGIFAAENFSNKTTKLSSAFIEIAALGRIYVIQNKNDLNVMDIMNKKTIFDKKTLSEKYIREEFSRGDVVVVDGWVLSLSEARFCASVYASIGVNG